MKDALATATDIVRKTWLGLSDDDTESNDYMYDWDSIPNLQPLIQAIANALIDTAKESFIEALQVSKR